MRSPRRFMFRCGGALMAALLLSLMAPAGVEGGKGGKGGGGNAYFLRVDVLDELLDPDQVLRPTRVYSDDLGQPELGPPISCDDDPDSYDYAASGDSCFNSVLGDSVAGDKIRSDCSPGGRWMFVLVIGYEPDPVRTITFDFSDRTDGTAGCADVVNLLQGHYLPGDLLNPCIYRVFIRLGADRLFKGGATRQAVEFRIKGWNLREEWTWRHDVLHVSYLNKLYICPDDSDPEVRTLQTLSCDGLVDVSEAEVWEAGDKPNNDILLGTFNLPLAFKLKRVPM